MYHSLFPEQVHIPRAVPTMLGAGPLDHWTLIAGGDDSDATAEAIATCAGIAPHSYEVAFSGQ